VVVICTTCLRVVEGETVRMWKEGQSLVGILTEIRTGNLLSRNQKLCLYMGAQPFEMESRGALSLSACFLLIL
jgi:hypothetical protein